MEGGVTKRKGWDPGPAPGTASHAEGSPHLVDEGGKFVVEGLDLLLFIPLHSLGIGVNLQVERGQQALVNSHCCDGWGCWSSNSSNSVAKARATEAIAETTSGPKPQANTTASPKP